MAALSDEIRRANLQAAIRAENAMQEKFASAGRTPLAEADALAVTPFASWCEAHGVRSCPARPTTVATWITERARDGVSSELILRTLEAIATQHNSHALANPTTAYVVRAALEPIITVEPPRSWPREDKARFAMLPI